MKRFIVYYHDRERRKKERVATWEIAQERAEIEGGKVTVMDTQCAFKDVYETIFKDGHVIGRRTMLGAVVEDLADKMPQEFVDRVAKLGKEKGWYDSEDNNDPDAG